MLDPSSDATDSAGRRSQRYDVFLSHSSADKPYVRALYDWLQKHDVKCFLDEVDLNYGDRLTTRLAEAIEASQSAIVCIGSNGEGPWRAEEIDTLLNRSIRLSRERNEFRVIPVRLPDADTSRLNWFLESRLWCDLTRGLDESQNELRRLRQAILGLRPDEGLTFDLKNPYRGLQPFHRESAKFFFGRNNESARLARTLRDHRFACIIGASGTGKSSLARAGLSLPVAEQELPGIGNWPLLTITPGNDLLRSVLDQVYLSLPDADRPEKVHTAMKRITSDSDTVTPEQWALGLDQELASRFADHNGPILILIDQLEEVFTHRACGALSEEQRAARTQLWLDGLAILRAQGSRRWHFVLTLRSDFKHRCRVSTRFWQLLYRDDRGLDQEYLAIKLEELDATNWRDAIKSPATRAGAYLEEGLVEVLLKDVYLQGGAMPLLQFALQELWKLRNGACLTHAAYKSLGGVANTLQRKAESTFQTLESENRTYREICRNLFLRLTSPGEGVIDSRRRVDRSELNWHQTDANSVNHVLSVLSDAENRLIVVDEQALEITHEVLIRDSATIHKWIEDARPQLPMLRRLTYGARQWNEEDRNPEYLHLAGPPKELKPWIQQTTIWLTILELEYCQECRRKPARELYETRRARRQLRVEEREQAARDRRSRNWFRGLFAFSMVLFVIALSFWLKANWTNTDLTAANISLERTKSTLKQRESSLEQANSVLMQKESALQTTNSALEHNNSSLKEANASLEKANSNVAKMNSAMQEDNHTTLLEATLQNCLRNELGRAEYTFNKILADLPPHFASTPETCYVQQLLIRRKPILLDSNATGGFEDFWCSDDNTLIAGLYKESVRSEQLPIVVHSRGGGFGSFQADDISFNLRGSLNTSRWSGAFDSLRVYRVADQDPLFSQRINQAYYGYRLCPYGKTVAAIRATNVISIWNTEDGAPFREFTLPLVQPVVLVALGFEPDGDRITAVASNGTLYSLALDTGAVTVLKTDLPMSEFYGFTQDHHFSSRDSLCSGYWAGQQLSLIHSRLVDGQFQGTLVRVLDERNARIIDLPTAKMTNTISREPKENRRPLSVALAAAAKLVVFTFTDAATRQYDAEVAAAEAYDTTGTLTREIEFARGGVVGRTNSKGLLPTARRAEGGVQVSIENMSDAGESTHYFLADSSQDGDSVPLRAVEVDEQGDMLLLEYEHRYVELWNIKSKKRIRRFSAPFGTELSCTPDGLQTLTVKSGSFSGHSAVIETEDYELTLPTDESVVCWYFSPNGSSVLTGLADGRLRLYDSGSGNVICETESMDEAPSGVIICGEDRVVGWNRKTIQLFDGKSGQAIPLDATLGVDDWNPEYDVVRLTPNGNALVVLTNGRYGDGKIVVLDPMSLKRVAIMSRLEAFDAINASPGNSILLCGGLSEPDGEDSEIMTVVAWDAWNNHECLEGVDLSEVIAVTRLGREGEVAFATRSATDVGFVGKLFVFSSPVGEMLDSVDMTQLPTALQFTIDGSAINVVTSAGLMRWDLPLLNSSPEINIKCDEIGLSGDGNSAALWTHNTVSLDVWDLASRVRHCVFRNESRPGEIRFLGPDSSQLLVCAQNGVRGELQIRSPRTMGECDIQTTRHSASGRHHGNVAMTVFGAAFSPGGDRVLLTDSNYTVTNWPLVDRRFAAGKVHHVGQVGLDGKTGHAGNVLGVAVSPDGERYATTGLDGSVRVWTVDPPQQELKVDPARPLGGVYRYAVAFDPSGRFMAISDNLHKQTVETFGGKIPQAIRVFKSGSNDEVFAFQGHDDVIWDASFSADGSRLATCGQDGTIRVWDFETARDGLAKSPTSEPQLHKTPVFVIPNAHAVADADAASNSPLEWVLCVQFSPDGSMLLSGGRDDQTMKLWDVETQALIHTFSDHRGSITRIRISSDGTRVFTACGDGLLRIWNLQTKARKLTLAGHEGAVWGLDLFEQDGVPQMLLSSGVDGTARIWDLKPDGHRSDRVAE